MKKTIEIPEGYEARIEGNKVILERKESEDERIRKAIESIIRVYGKTQGEWLAGYDMDTLVVHLRDAFAYLERQKEQKPLSTEETELNSIAFLEQMGYTCIPPRKEQPEVELEKEIAQTYHDGSVADTSNMDHIDYENLLATSTNLDLTQERRSRYVAV